MFITCEIDGDVSVDFRTAANVVDEARNLAYVTLVNADYPRVLVTASLFSLQQNNVVVVRV